MKNDEFCEAFAERLRVLRRNSGLSCKKLGLAIGLGEKTAERTIQKWERKEQSPRMEYARPLTTALDCTLEELIP